MAFIQQNKHAASWYMGGPEEHHTGKKPIREATDWMTAKRKTKEHMDDKGKKESFPLVVQKYSQFEYGYQWPVNIVFICKKILFHWTILFSGIIYYVNYFYKIIYKDYRYFLKNL